jgi:plastocyanin
MERRIAARLAACGLAAAACNTPAPPPPPANGFVIVIDHLAFTPATLSVPPGATVQVLNEDAVPHSVTSEVAAGAYASGAVNGVAFDTGEFTASVRTFTIPADAPDGTVIPFFCLVHGPGMTPPDGSVTVSRAAGAAQ